MKFIFHTFFFFNLDLVVLDTTSSNCFFAPSRVALCAVLCGSWFGGLSVLLGMLLLRCNISLSSGGGAGRRFTLAQSISSSVPHGNHFQPDVDCRDRQWASAALLLLVAVNLGLGILGNDTWDCLILSETFSTCLYES